jgi:hypothetical protein
MAKIVVATFFYYYLSLTIKSRITTRKSRFKKKKFKKWNLHDLECWVATNYRTSLRAPFRDWIVWSGSFCIATSWATRRAWKSFILWHRYAGCKAVWNMMKMKSVLFIPVTNDQKPFIVFIFGHFLVFCCFPFGSFRDLSYNDLDLGSDNVFPHLDSLLDLYVHI